MQEIGGLPIDSHPAWRLPRRPPSAVERLELEVHIGLPELRALYDDAVCRGAEGRRAAASLLSSFFRGYVWNLGVLATKDASGVTFMPTLLIGPPRDPGGGLFAFKAVGACATLTFTTSKGSFGSEDCPIFSGSWGVGVPHLFGLAPMAAWDEGAWRAAGLVGDDGKVLVRAVIADVA
ncbi:MAG: hypothetical protein J3K34DRAFT_411096 [Monoraphidium minutum]|nr:MAG: hypothetical protein J3K34DRAFT_411096 [Monoraphidium minutum]